MIAEKAEQVSKDPKYLSPFAAGAWSHFYDYAGGKEDDVSVIVAQVVENK